MQTIIVHITNDETYKVRLKSAINIAFSFNSHLIALFTPMPAYMPDSLAGRGASQAYLTETKKMQEKVEDEIKKEILSECKNKGISWEWVSEDGPHLDVIKKYANYSDLTIISQTDPSYFEEKLLFHLADSLPYHTGTPTLILPFKERSLKNIGKNILIAWGPTKEAIRAVRDSLPILKKAEKIHIITSKSKEDKTLPDIDIASFLSRHRIKTTLHADIEDSDNIGKRILQRAQELECDLIVMGSYGKSRLKELFFGGTTRHVLNNMHIPIIMSH